MQADGTAWPAASAAAIAAWRILGAGDGVGGIVSDDHHLVEVRPHRNDYLAAAEAFRQVDTPAERFAFGNA